MNENKTTLFNICNKNFNKGVSIFQMFLMGFIILGVIFSNEFLVLFSMFICLFGYFEPNVDRFSLGGKKNDTK